MNFLKKWLVRGAKAAVKKYGNQVESKILGAIDAAGDKGTHATKAAVQKAFDKIERNED